MRKKRIIRSSEADVQTLQQAGYAVREDLWTAGFRRAWVERRHEGVKVEWCQDAAWRFFPIERDDLLGWKLNRFDALTNKTLAMGGRSETRDLVDMVADAPKYPVHAVIWAACAKDPGYNPPLLLNQMQRNSRVNPSELKEMGAAIQPVELKTRWLELAEIAQSEINRAASAGIEPGLAFVSGKNAIGWFDTPGCEPHRASLAGSLPRLVGVNYGK